MVEREAREIYLKQSQLAFESVHGRTMPGRWQDASDPKGRSGSVGKAGGNTAPSPFNLWAKEGKIRTRFPVLLLDLEPVLALYSLPCASFLFLPCLICSGVIIFQSWDLFRQ